MELALVDQPPISVGISGVCANTQGSFDCDCDGIGFDGPTYDSCKYWWCLC